MKLNFGDGQRLGAQRAPLRTAAPDGGGWRPAATRL